MFLSNRLLSSLVLQAGLMIFAVSFLPSPHFFVPKVDSLQVLHSGPSSCVFDAEERDIGSALAPSQINRRDLNPQSWTKLSRKLYTWTAFF